MRRHGRPAAGGRRRNPGIRRPVPDTRTAAPILVGVLLAGCGVLPEPPGAATSPVPDSPAAAVTATPTTARSSSPDGLSAVERAAVRVRNVACAGVASGSGFALDARLLVTNAHVVGGASQLQLDTYDGRDIEVGTAGAATIADLALVRTTGSLPAVVPMAAADPRAGDPVSVVGYPGGGPLRTSSGVVLGYTDDPLGANIGQVLATDAHVEPGSSGSAMVDEAGAVVGVVFARDDADRSYAVPVSTLRDLLHQPDQFVPLADCD